MWNKNFCVKVQSNNYFLTMWDTKSELSFIVATAKKRPDGLRNRGWLIKIWYNYIAWRVIQKTYGYDEAL
jgi:hypothetical protein